MVFSFFLKDLLSAANLLQLEEVKDVCCDFLQTQLCTTNCIFIYAIADLHSCTKLSTSSELYIQHNFSYEIQFNIYKDILFNIVIF